MLKFNYLLASFIISLMLSQMHSALASQTDWHIVQDWQSRGELYSFKAENSTLITQCRQQPNAFINFPTVVQAAQQIYLDKQLIASHGDPAMQSVATYYGAPVIPCMMIQKGGTLTWDVFSFSKELANFKNYPFITSQPSYLNMFQENFNIMAFGALLILAIFFSVLFHGRISPVLYYSILFSCLCCAVYFWSTVGGKFNSPFSMLTSHKIGDSFLLFGLVFFFNALRFIGMCHRYFFLFTTTMMAIALFVIIFAKNGDQAQLGTSLGFIPALLTLLHALYRAINQTLRNNTLRANLFQILSLIIFSASCINDVLTVSGFIDSYFIFSVGIVFGLLCQALSVNQNITEAYQEREKLNRSLMFATEQTIKLDKKVQKLAKNNKRLFDLNTLDDLTQLKNRKFFDAALDTEWIKGDRLNTALSLLFIDIDHFKQINDTYGHLEGDNCLSIVAKILRHSARREADVVCRYGGEEFAILLPYTKIEHAIVVAERIRSHIEGTELHIATLNKKIKITVSIGVASVIDYTNKQSISLIEQSDAMLYKAKKAGRNTIKVFQVQ